MSHKMNRTWKSQRRTLVVALAIMAALFFATPSASRAALWQTLGQAFGFHHAPSDTIATDDGVGPPPPLHTLATVEEAEALVGFDLLTPADLPPGVVLGNVQVVGDPTDQIVRITYVDEQGFSYLSIMVSAAEHPEVVGAGAQVESVQVRGVAGEYVRGGWVGANTTSTTSTWDNSFPSGTLSWQEGDVFYRVSTSQLSKTELITLSATFE